MSAVEETVEYLCLENKFFDKTPNARITVNFDYEIDQLAKCLESEGVPVNKYEAMQLLDVYIRSLCGIINMTPLTDNINVIKQLNVIIGSKDFPEVTGDKIEKMSQMITTINEYSFVKFTNNTLKNILSHIEIVFKECNTFINELKAILYRIYTSYGSDAGIDNILGIVEIDTRFISFRFTSNYPENVIYTDNYAFNIVSNMISYPRFFQERVSVIGDTFSPDDKKFKEFREKLEKTTEFKKE